jgi:hypothetical protein
MTLLVNPGSGAVLEGRGYTNTYARARCIAWEWLARIHADGMREVVLVDRGRDLNDGRWVFTFTHPVTGVVVELETHGVDDTEAYQRLHVFLPRTYWDGSSTASPKLDDWYRPGFEPVCTFRAATS